MRGRAYWAAVYFYPPSKADFVCRVTTGVTMNKKIFALDIAKKLADSGWQAYFAGGCVRDAIMEIDPVDYDIATDARPEQVMKLFPRTIPVGIQFGVVLVIMGGISYQVTTFRKDGLYVNGRHPSTIGFSSSAQEDVIRRDFTINGLLYDPFQDRILDYVEGIKDINSGIIRAIGDPQARMQEDKLRMMRAVRFACRYRYQIEVDTLQSIKKLAPKIKQVSIERIRDELDKIIRGKHPGLGLQMLSDMGLMKHIMPEIDAMIGVMQPEEFHPEGDVFTHTKVILDLLKDPSRVLAFAALLHDVGKPKTFVRAERIRFDGHVPAGARMANEICHRLKFSNNERERIVDYVSNHLKFMDVKKMREAKLKRFMQDDTFIEQLELHRVDCLASHGKLDNWEFCRQKQAEYSKEELKPVPLLTGDDLINIGYRPGPMFKEILAGVSDLQLENKIKTKEDALTWVRNNYKI